MIDTIHIKNITVKKPTIGQSSVIIAMPLMVVYNVHLKGKPLVGNIAVSFVIGLSFLFCGAAHQNYGPMWLPAILSFGLTFLRELVKDVADLKGDLSTGLATFPILIGIYKSRQLIIFLCFYTFFA